MKLPPQRQEQTGDAPLDRIQGAARELLTFAREKLSRLLNGHGDATMSSITLSGGSGKAHVMTPAEFAGFAWLFEGTLAGDAQVRVPSGTWTRQVYNNTLGGFQVTLVNAEGSVAVPSLTGYLIINTPRFGPESWL